MEEEKVFSCLRCGYTCRHKHHLLAHINKKNPCLPLLQDITLQDLNDSIKMKKESIHKCNMCKKSFSTSSNRLRHEKDCNKRLQ